MIDHEIDSDLYWHAAELMDDETKDGIGGACDAIGEAARYRVVGRPSRRLSDRQLEKVADLSWAHQKAFLELFHPSQRRGLDYGAYWGSAWGDDAQACRVLSLCLMAAMVEAEEAELREVTKKLRRAARTGQIEFASDERLAAHGALVDDFMRTAFDLEPGSYFISDMSDMRDWSQGDATAAWPKIEARYKVPAERFTSTLLVDMLDTIVRGGNANL